VTWPFFYLVSLVVGLALGAVTGLVGRRRYRPFRHQVTLPRPEHHFTIVNAVGQWLSVALAAFGVAGLVAKAGARAAPGVALQVALGAAAAATLLAVIVWRPRITELPSGRATVVRGIPPAGYGQVQLRHLNRTILMAARSEDGQPIPPGEEVDLIECESSVLTVRRVRSGADAAK
jgi:hypothetical protein